MPFVKKQPTTPKPANMALMSEKNELKHVFRKLKTGDSVEEMSDNESVKESKRSTVVIVEQPEVVDNGILEKKLDEFERQAKKAAAEAKLVEQTQKQVEQPGKSFGQVKLKKKKAVKQKSSSESDSEEEQNLPG